MVREVDDPGRHHRTAPGFVVGAGDWEGRCKPLSRCTHRAHGAWPWYARHLADDNRDELRTSGGVGVITRF